ncbi:MAG TPA: diguanylate cyclase [Gemmatimonadales bacterium]|nr:diguanylate cyclase [Gemmatimonadales bacterium]
MITWERVASQQLRKLRLDRVRSKILAFSVLATLIPSVTTAWLSYTQGKRGLTTTISTELVGVSSQAASDVGLWFKERLYDLHVFASSYEVSQNVGRSVPGNPWSDRRLGDYLASVQERSGGYYRELIVFDAHGREAASSAQAPTNVALPHGWDSAIRSDDPLIGLPRWDEAAKTMVVVVAVPIRPAGGRTIGALAAKLDLRDAGDMLRRATDGHVGHALLVGPGDQIILTSRPGTEGPRPTSLPAAMASALTASPNTVAEYTDPDGTEAIGTLRPVPTTGWNVVAELSRTEGFAQVNRLRNVTILVLGGLFVVVGLLAYALGLILVRPLDRLTKGAERVAGGDFDVDLPVVTGGELGYLTEVFNDMVHRLRHGRDELAAINETLREKNAQLERLSLTDPLTGLYNRRHLMTMLEAELRRGNRSDRGFAILMMDVDHFKTYNDAFGHQAGDDALMKVAGVLRTALREMDCPARYGGEEFVALLPDTTIDQAEEAAERIRARVGEERFIGGQITLSIGVAEFPTHGTALDSLIASADAALYQAKRMGRDRVVRADWASALKAVPAKR